MTLRRLLFALLVQLGTAGTAHALWDVIPGATMEFRGALGSVNRPYANPDNDGPRVEITLAPDGCDATPPGFADLSRRTKPDDDSPARES